MLINSMNHYWKPGASWRLGRYAMSPVHALRRIHSGIEETGGSYCVIQVEPAAGSDQEGGTPR
jgi:hypothetical protein